MGRGGAAFLSPPPAAAPPAYLLAVAARCRRLVAESEASPSEGEMRRMISDATRYETERRAFELADEATDEVTDEATDEATDRRSHSRSARRPRGPRPSPAPGLARAGSPQAGRPAGHQRLVVARSLASQAAEAATQARTLASQARTLASQAAEAAAVRHGAPWRRSLAHAHVLEPRAAQAEAASSSPRPSPARHDAQAEAASPRLALDTGRRGRRHRGVHARAARLGATAATEESDDELNAVEMAFDEFAAAGTAPPQLPRRMTFDEFAAQYLILEC